MTSTKKTLRATFAAIAAATLTMTATPYALAVDGEESAEAIPGASAFEEQQLASVKDMPTEANLIIHKSTQTENPDVRDDGTRNPDKEGALPVKGVKFKVYRMTKMNGEKDEWDVTTNEGWRTASEEAGGFNSLGAQARKKAIESGTWQYTVGEGEDEETKTVSGVTFTLVKNGRDDNTFVTDARGEANTGKLPRGIYAVVEVPVDEYRDEVKIAEGDTLKPLGTKSLTGAMPFIAFLPMTDQDDTSKWLRTVNVYPKNSVTNIEKEVKDIDKPGVGNGDETSQVEYTVYTDVPKMAQSLDDYQIVDSMPARVTYVDESAKVQVGTTSDDPEAPGEYKFTEEVGDNALTAEDYTLKSYYGGRMIIVNFTKEGLKKLDKLGGKRVQLKFKANIGQLEVGTVAASLTNSAYLIPPNQGHGDWTPKGKDKKCVKLDEDGNPVYEEIGRNGKKVGASEEVPGEGDNPPTGGDDAGEATQGGMKPAEGDKPLEAPASENPEKNIAEPKNGNPETDAATDDCLPEPPGTRVEVTSKYGKIKIEKVDKEDNSRKLAGAVFQLYTCNADGVKTAWDNEFKLDTEEGVTAKPVKVNGFDHFTTLAPGKTADTKEKAIDQENYQPIVISGLELNNWSNAKSRTGNNGKIDATGRYYCLFEVKAPAGYTLLPEPIKFQLLDDGTENEAPVQTRNIANVANNAGFDLPLTGGKGVLPLIALGGLLVVGAGGYAAVAAKRNRKEA